MLVGVAASGGGSDDGAGVAKELHSKVLFIQKFKLNEHTKAARRKPNGINMEY